MRNVNFDGRRKLSSWRKIAIGTWNKPSDPSVYGTIEVNAKNAIEYMAKLSEKSGQRITITHFLGKVIAEIYKTHPELNVVMRFGYLYQRKDVDIFFQAVSNLGGEDLSGIVVRQADRKTLLELAKDVESQNNRLKTEGDTQFKIKKNFKYVPPFLMPFLMNLTAFLVYKLNFWTPLMGTPRDPMGSVMITNIGSLGIDEAFAPLVPYSHVPAVITVGTIKDKVIAENGQMVIAPMLKISVCLDHRIIDGFHAGKMSVILREIFENPEALD